MNNDQSGLRTRGDWCPMMFYSSIAFRGSLVMKCNHYKELSSGTKNSELSEYQKVMRTEGHNRKQ